MVKLRAVMVCWHSDDFPGWVEISVRDVRGQDHRIIEKVPVLTSLHVTADSRFPIMLWIEVEAESIDGDEITVALPDGMETTEGRGSLVVVSAEADRERYRDDRGWLDYSIHELPAGVLWGADGATPAQCAEMLAGLDEFALVCARLGLDDHSEFIDACRWHFDHYPHYLSRRRHFSDYPTYIRDRRGPLRVPPPPGPDWLRRRQPSAS
ncbi:hypothetical protein F6X68_25395 [Micromonospora sp. AMSO12t]|uniref:hypothetical protein n=1 Tax=unclassified Micromonospora TaxID=2617518 RepID=UPI00124B5BB9|nr:hypothetical protein [Micromonospora sp. AMSO12t]KAB1138785.1 hypothetical protein F6X68_25395 [Micromonospora sp. AMSO12t]